MIRKIFIQLVFVCFSVYSAAASWQQEIIYPSLVELVESSDVVIVGSSMSVVPPLNEAPGGGLLIGNFEETYNKIFVQQLLWDKENVINEFSPIIVYNRIPYSIHRGEDWAASWRLRIENKDTLYLYFLRRTERKPHWLPENSQLFELVGGRCGLVVLGIKGKNSPIIDAIIENSGKRIDWDSPEWMGMILEVGEALQVKRGEEELGEKSSQLFLRLSNHFFERRSTDDINKRFNINLLEDSDPFLRALEFVANKQRGSDDLEGEALRLYREILSDKSRGLELVERKLEFDRKVDSLGEIQDQEELARISLTDKDHNIRRLATRAITDKDVLNRIVFDKKSLSGTRMAAIKSMAARGMINDENLKKIATDYENDYLVRCEAVKYLSCVDILAEIADSDPDENVRTAARAKIERTIAN